MKPSRPRAFVSALIFSTTMFAPAHAQDASAGRNLAAACFTCHGTNGHSVGGIPPSLAGRDRDELFRTMKEFQSGKRPATIMHQQAKGYTDEQIKLIAAYFASVKPAPAATLPKVGY